MAFGVGGTSPKSTTASKSQFPDQKLLVKFAGQRKNNRRFGYLKQLMEHFLSTGIAGRGYKVNAAQ